MAANPLITLGLKLSERVSQDIFGCNRDYLRSTPGQSVFEARQLPRSTVGGDRDRVRRCAEVLEDRTSSVQLRFNRIVDGSFFAAFHVCVRRLELGRFS